MGRDQVHSMSAFCRVPIAPGDGVIWGYRLMYNGNLAQALGQSTDTWEILLPPEEERRDKAAKTPKKPINTWWIPFPPQKWWKRPDAHCIDVRRFKN